MTTPTLTTLIDFNNGNGSQPLAGLLSDAADNLYGTTFTGGAYGYGTVFELSGANHQTLTTLVNFTGSGSGNNGANPQAVLVADAAGNLFGTTQNGGASSYGTVYELSGANHQTLSTLVNFTSFAVGSDGAYPVAGLLADAAGNLYGTTAGGGTDGYGTVYELSGANHQTLTTLFEFRFVNGAINGARPQAGLVADAAGNLYGTTSTAGAYGYGTVFELSGANHQTLTTLVNFTGTGNGNNGRAPSAGLVADAAGNLYGTTPSGGAYNRGTVFELSGADHQTLTTLVNFTGKGRGGNGGGPRAGLLVDAAGNLFGTSAQNYGTVFELSGGDHRTLTTLVNFTGNRNGNNGAYPEAGLVADAAGNLYGTTESGGTNGAGTVFEIINSGYFVSPPFMTLNAPTGTAHSTHPTITGHTNTNFANTRVTLYEGTQKLGTATVAADGSFSAAVTLANGLHNLTATHTDAAHNTITSAAQQVLVLAPTTTGALNLKTDLTLSDADLAGLTNLTAINLSGHGASSLTLGANAAADFGANPIKVTAAAGVLSLAVDGSALTTAFSVKGGNGADSFIGGTGNDTFTGGAGADLFDLSQGGRDMIADFVHGTDHIRYAGHSMADLHITYSRGSASIVIDSTHQATLSHVAAGSLAASDFIFS